MTRVSRLARCFFVPLVASVMAFAGPGTSSGERIDHRTTVRAAAKASASPASKEWKEIRLPQWRDADLRWCESTRTMTITGGGVTGVRLLEVATGAVHVLTTGESQRSIGCSRDGRYVFFVDRDTFGSDKLSAYDLVTREQAELYSFTTEFFRGAFPNLPLSPTNDYLVAPFGPENELRLPGGQRVRRVAVGSGANIPPELASRFAAYVWSADGRTIVFLDVDLESVVIYEVRSQTARTLELIDGYAAIKLRLTADLTQLYFLATNDESNRLYVKDLTQPDQPSQLLVLDADDFDLFPSGELLYSKLRHVTRSKGALELRIRRPSGKDELFWSTPFHNTKSEVTSLNPMIAPDGNGIAMFYGTGDGDRNLSNVLLIRTRKPTP